MRLASAAKLRRANLKLESLEGREVPSVVDVTNAGGVLKLVGDDESSGVTIKQLAGSVDVTPNATTDVGNGLGVLKNFTGAATSISADLKGGDDSVAIDGASPLTLTGAATFKMGDGDNSVILTTTAKIELGSLSVVTGDGQDFATVSGGVGLGSKISGNASFDFKIGQGILSLVNTEIQGSGGVKVKVAPNGGGASVGLNTVKIAKTLDVDSGIALLGAGVNTVDSTLGGLKIKGFVAAAGLENSTVNGKVSLSGQKYRSQLSLENSKITGDTSLKGNFYSTMSVNGASETGNITITANLISTLDASNAATTSLKINGKLSVSAKDAAVVDFGSTALSQVTGNVSIKATTLYARLITNHQITFDKDVTVSLGNAGGSVVIGNATAPVAIGGNLKITGGGGDSFVDLSNVAVGTVAAPKNASIKLGAGNDTVSIDLGSTFSGKFDADFGAGDDSFEVAQNLAATADVVFTGKVTVKMGSGNDSLELGILTGGTPFTVAVFNGAGSKIDGQSGFNIFDSAPAIANIGGTGLPLTSIVNFIDP